MRSSTLLRPLPVALAAALSFAALPAAAMDHAEKDGKSHEAAATETMSTDIVDTAIAAGDFTTLVAAVGAAGLVETLKGEGPFTVFAPTDAAFAALPDGTVDTLLMEENKAQLTEILTCHVVGANAVSSAIAQMIADDGGAHPVPTLGGCTLTAEMTDDNGITLTDENGNVANVVVADVTASNGVVHVIDAVLMPAADAEEKMPM